MKVGMEGLGIGMEVDQRLRGEEGVERHIFGHSRETGENFLDLAKVRKMFHHRKETGETSLLVELLFTCLIVVKLQFRMILTSMSLSDEHNCSNTNILTKGGLQFFKAWKSSGIYGAPSWQILPMFTIGTNLTTTTMMMTMTG